MSLTKRRLQFLHKLMDLYQKTNLPIHYETLAKAIGVSKWTAYDMLKEIEKLGFISRSYEVNTKETGRSQVVFVPTAKASELFSQPRSESFDLADWNRTVTHISRLLKDLKHTGLNEALRKMIDEIWNTNTRLKFCAYMIGLLLVYLKKLGGKTESLIRHMVQKAPSKETGMTMFIGSVLGTIIQTMNDDLGLEITELVSKLLKSVADLSREEKEWLSDILERGFAA
ncbi:Lrp/AsnC family transcriptional regulator [Paenibacillus thermoaerophilus]|uniref:Lrp/AsnC family transcriptional regulator n=1 Tax=Paenibacillus thermoaerophilus TaxID=1215385 RepID=A0ABW2V2M3_9BACL|nr:Lrp/AsnC family transcriptional regulator [Paenibacillus thermoaerophilus]TMV09391.1 Lrp/AsnC family transcriptional regulator [Paenibacillus thermoaerophilus]